jgi:membrane protease YdiL (CAAX protease family)
VICLTASVGAPVVEEIFFRGLLLSSLQSLPVAWFVERFRGALPIVTSGLIFAAAHVQAVQFAGLAIAGTLFAFIRHREGRIAPSIFAHAGFNAIALMVTFHLYLIL